MISNSLRRLSTLRSSPSIGARLVRGAAVKSSSCKAAFSGKVADLCDLHICRSPFPPVDPPPYPPLAEFVMQNWKPCGGYLDDKIAIIDGSTGLQRTFADYYKSTCSLAAVLRYDMDVEESSSVAIYCPNHVDYLPVSLAVSLCGAKLTPVNPLYTSKELETVLTRSRSSVLVAHVTMLDVALEAAKKSSLLKHVIVVTDNGEVVPEGTIPLDSLRDHDKAFDTTVHKVHPNTDAHPCLIPYSSGTTGLPKGVCLSHSNLVVNLKQLEAVEALAFPSSHKVISPLPFFHIYAYLVSMLYCAWHGQELITMSKRFDLELFCRLVEEHKPQRAHLVPPILLGLAKHPLVDNFDMSSLQMVISAAAPLGADAETAVKERLGIEVKQAWGMSELSPLGTINSDFNYKTGSVGPICSSAIAKIVNEKGKSLGPNEPGELCIKGPQVMMGYIDDPDKTAECLSSSGWLRTGDIAYYDEEGYFFITDRLKELIKVRGFQVAPAELEALLLTHEHVADAAVVPIEDEAAGELPRAYVVKGSSEGAASLTESDIFEWVKGQVAPYKRLHGGVVFTNEIPKSASGKILRRILRDQAKEESK